MKASLEIRLFRKALEYLDDKSARSIVMNMVDKTSVSLTCWGDKKCVRLFLPAEVETEGFAILSFHYLLSLVKLEGTAVFELKNASLHVRIEGKNLKFPTEINDKYLLTIPRIKSTGTVTVELDEVKEMFEHVLFASRCIADSCYDYQYIMLKCDTNSLRAIGSDRRIAAQYTIPKGSSYCGQFLLTKSVIATLRKLSGDLLTLSFSDRGLLFSVSEDFLSEIYVGEFRATFPPYEEFINITGKSFMKGRRDELLSLLYAIKNVSDSVYINLKFKEYVKQPVLFYAKDEDGAVVNFPTDMDWEGEEIRIKVNSHSLYDGIQRCKDTVKLSFINDMAPLSVECAEGNFRCSMMPYSPVEKR